MTNRRIDTVIRPGKSPLLKVELRHGVELVFSADLPVDIDTMNFLGEVHQAVVEGLKHYMEREGSDGRGRQG